jgi:hypothetical protein
VVNSDAAPDDVVNWIQRRERRCEFFGQLAGYRFSLAAQFVTTVMKAGDAWSVSVFTRNRWPSRLGT